MKSLILLPSRNSSMIASKWTTRRETWVNEVGSQFIHLHAAWIWFARPRASQPLINVNVRAAFVQKRAGGKHPSLTYFTLPSPLQFPSLAKRRRSTSHAKLLSLSVTSSTWLRNTLRSSNFVTTSVLLPLTRPRMRFEMPFHPPEHLLITCLVLLFHTHGLFDLLFLLFCAASLLQHSRRWGCRCRRINYWSCY